MRAPTLKDGSGKELRCRHDELSQHLRPLRAMKYEPSGPFITAVIEEKLGQMTTFKWQRHSQESPDVPHYNDLLRFLDLRAQVTGTDAHEAQRRVHQPGRRTSAQYSKVSYLVGISDSCTVCKKGKHP